MKNTITEDLIGRLQSHVRMRGAPSIKNGAWAMMLEAAAQLQTLQKAVFELQEMVSDLEEQRDTLKHRHEALLARLSEPTEKMVFAAARDFGLTGRMRAALRAGFVAALKEGDEDMTMEKLND